VARAARLRGAQTVDAVAMVTRQDANDLRLGRPAGEQAAVPLVRRLLSQGLLLTMRVGVAGAKALLAFYTARFLSLADLGVYGLLIAGTTIVPAVAGFGMTDWIARKIVDLPRAEAVELIVARLSLTVCVHLCVQPLALGLDLLLGQPIPIELAAMGGLILLLEHIGSESNDLLVARRRVLMSQTLSFLRAAVWPLLVIAIGLLVPSARTLTFMLSVWLIVVAVNALVLLALFWSRMGTLLVPVHIGLLLQQLRGSWVLYVRDLSNMVSIFSDRFIISTVLGLELTGVYTLFWSIANVIYSVVVVGLLLTQVAPLVDAAKRGYAQFSAVKRRIQIELACWIVLLAAGAAIVTPLLLPFLGRPLLQANLAVFWIVLFAMIMRIAADGYGFVLLALQRDRAIAVVAVLSAVTSAAATAVMTSLLGLWGAAVAFAASATAIFIVRYCLTALNGWETSRPTLTQGASHGAR
jgi:O-antigen/teichoic acid export membrane protein